MVNFKNVQSEYHYFLKLTLNFDWVSLKFNQNTPTWSLLRWKKTLLGKLQISLRKYLCKFLEQYLSESVLVIIQQALKYLGLVGHISAVRGGAWWQIG